MLVDASKGVCASTVVFASSAMTTPENKEVDLDDWMILNHYPD
jgi:hypothetical protein